MYELPEDFQSEEVSVDTEMRAAIKKLADNGHQVDPALFGEMRGHKCLRCNLFRVPNKFKYWIDGPLCQPLHIAACTEK